MINVLSAGLIDFFQYQPEVPGTGPRTREQLGESTLVLGRRFFPRRPGPVQWLKWPEWVINGMDG